MYLFFRFFMSPSEDGPSCIPEGYIVLQIDNERYVVPEHLVPALHQAYVGNKKKGELEIEKAAGTVSTILQLRICRTSEMPNIGNAEHRKCRTSEMPNIGNAEVNIRHIRVFLGRTLITLNLTSFSLRFLKIVVQDFIPF
jgi:hypothetical protein